MADLDDKLVSQVPAKIDGRFIAEIVTMGIKASRATATPGGAAGNIGVSQGNLKLSGTVTLVILDAAGQGIDIDTLSTGSHTLSYPVGPRRYILQGFTLSDEDLQIDNDAGSVRISGSFVALRRLRR